MKSRASGEEDSLSSVVFEGSCVQDRRALFEGTLFVYNPRPAALGLVDLARTLLDEAFFPRRPVEAQHYLSVDAYASILSAVKPRFIHHPECKKLIRQLLEELGADTEQIYFDVPRLRSATANDYLTSGIAYAFHPHRDTWYSAPQAQVNWWFPVYAIEPENCMAMYPQCFAQPLPNSSATYNYYRWNLESRGQAGQLVGTDTRVQPKLTAEVSLGPELRIVTPVGSVLAFSGQQLHATVPNSTNVTRFSIDFRTVHIADLEQGNGAPNTDAYCTGTTLRDFRRCTDLAELPTELVGRYDDASSLAYANTLVYTPSDD
jgi:hypothetical protein